MTSADIVEMPVAERLKLMETLWESLCAQPGAEIESPGWHGEVLAERTRRIDSGEETVSSWKEAKARIRAQIKAD
jgi:putative addiction module component (TIGR02574 family)